MKYINITDIKLKIKDHRTYQDMEIELKKELTREMERTLKESLEKLQVEENKEKKQKLIFQVKVIGIATLVTTLVCTISFLL